jgi:FixJ family two-component response regulator
MRTEPTVFVIDEDASGHETAANVARTLGLQCKAYTSALEFLEERDEAVPGCVVMEARMMAISGLQVQQRLLSKGDPIAVVFVVAHAAILTIVKAMRNGATHFLQKPPSDQELWDAIQEAVQLGQERLQIRQKRQQLKRRIARLTARERQVFQMIGQEKLNRTIASELGVCVRTVEIHRAKLMSKLDVQSLPALVRIAGAVTEGYADTFTDEGCGVLDTV